MDKQGSILQNIGCSNRYQFVNLYGGHSGGWRQSQISITPTDRGLQHRARTVHTTITCICATMHAGASTTS